MRPGFHLAGLQREEISRLLLEFTLKSTGLLRTPLIAVCRSPKGTQHHLQFRETQSAWRRHQTFSRYPVLVEDTKAKNPLATGIKQVVVLRRMIRRQMLLRCTISRCGLLRWSLWRSQAVEGQDLTDAILICRVFCGHRN